jgi:hypothetical protein
VREVAEICDSCGGRRYVPVDAWSDRPDASFGGFVCEICRFRAAVRSAWQPAVFWIFVLAGLVAAVVELSVR